MMMIITCLAGDGKRVEKSNLEDDILPRRSTSLFSSLSPSMSFSSPSLAYILPELHIFFFLSPPPAPPSSLFSMCSVCFRYIFWLCGSLPKTISKKTCLRHVFLKNIEKQRPDLVFLKKSRETIESLVLWSCLSKKIWRDNRKPASLNQTLRRIWVLRSLSF